MGDKRKMEKEEQEKRIEHIKKRRDAEALISKNVNENPDSIEIGTPSKGGAIKIYGDFADKETFKKKIDAAKEVREYAQANIAINI